MEEKPERIAKVLARAGLCSRREAERWITDGRVAVDDVVLESPAFTVTAANRIVVDGKLLPGTEPTRLWRYHKPAGLLTTQHDPEGRKTIFDTLSSTLPRVISVGRLDMSSEGLLLLTNDGALARRLELPSTGWIRRYRVRVHGRVQESALNELRRGMTVEKVHYAPIEVSLDGQTGANAWLTMALREGKNREIRRLCENLGWRVNRLIRMSFGSFQLGTLRLGAVDEMPRKVLAEQLGAERPEDKQQPKKHFKKQDKPIANRRRKT
ncbi:MAG: pseudouridine synthase [Proteobacteria bacterium]|nr:pseudouridine synthase [Pseudomonadota bacterium]